MLSRKGPREVATAKASMAARIDPTDGKRLFRGRRLVFLGALAVTAIGCGMIAGIDSLTIAAKESIDAGLEMDSSPAEIPLDAPLMIDGAGDVGDVSLVLDGGVTGSVGDSAACVSGPDGTVCGEATSCSVPPTCEQGACTAHLLEAGTACGGPAPVCHQAGACNASGACVSTPLANGTSCGTTTSPCQRQVCENGSCQLANVVNGTACNPGNVCKTGACEDGGCAATNRPNGYKPASGNRCCSGAQTALDTTSNCGACGLKCESGASCQSISGHFACSCPNSDAVCKSTGYGSLATCYAATSAGQFCNCQCNSPLVTTTCTGQCAGGATCYVVSGQNYCAYP